MVPALIAAAGWVIRLSGYAIKAAPWLITILAVFSPFSTTLQNWFAKLALAILPTSVFDVADFSTLPQDYLTALNTFIPLDTVMTSFAAYVPFFIACVLHRLAKSMTPTSR